MAPTQSTIRSPRHLGAFIHDARKERNLTQEALATAAGVSRSWLIGIEQGKRQRAELDKIFSLLQALHIDLILEQSLPPEKQPDDTTPHHTAHTAPLNSSPTDITEFIRASIPHFGHATGISQALNQQERKNNKTTQ